MFYRRLKFYFHQIMSFLGQLDILDFAGGELKVTGEINYENKDAIYDISVGLDHKDFSKVHYIFDLPKVLEDFQPYSADNVQLIYRVGSKGPDLREQL